MTPLDRAIYRVLAYFAYFGYPMTALEIWKWCPGKEEIAYEAIVDALRTSEWLARYVSGHDGFWGLGDDVEAQVDERARRRVDALRKQHKLAPYLKYLARLDVVRGAALCNSMALHHTKPTSDIDLFVICRDGKLWSTRLWCVGPLALLRSRPGESADPIDTNFFLSENALSIESLKIGTRDPYLAFWVGSLLPVIDKDGVFPRLREQNEWAFTNWPRLSSSRPARALRSRPVSDAPAHWFSESVARRIQSWKLPQEIRDRAGRDTSVVMNAAMLKFHKNDRRADVLAWLEEKMKVCDAS